MADVRPFRALHYDLEKVGGLPAVVSPPYDVIDPQQRSELAARSPYNVVEIDLPESYERARELFAAWQEEGALTRDSEPALWAMEQDYTGPDGRRYRRHGFFARVKVEDYGPGRIRPHERTHPGPKEDRLKLTRATNANLSPIFALYDDPAEEAWGALAPAVASGEPWGAVTDEDGTEHRIWRIADEPTLQAVTAALADRELLIADGHHRYETARVFHTEEGGAGHVLMCLVSLQDPGLTVFPTHRLLVGLDDAKRAALEEAIERDWIAEPADDPRPGGAELEIGYLDSSGARRLRPRSLEVVDRALAGRSEPYRRLDTAVLEALLLQGALGMTEDDISHLNGLTYSRSDEEAFEMIRSGEADAAFFMAPAPVSQVRDVAASGENMPPKSTYFFPKVLTGLLFNPLD
jgi:uncharacterized protein (DUF1015 family)